MDFPARFGALSTRLFSSGRRPTAWSGLLVARPRAALST